MSIGQFAVIKCDVYEQITRITERTRIHPDQNADAHGIDQSDYSKLETGKRYYTFEQLKKLALALDTSMDYLAGLTDEKKPYPRRNG